MCGRRMSADRDEGSKESPSGSPRSPQTPDPGGENRLALYRSETRAVAGELAAGVVHDINNPLQVMMLHLELLQAGRPMPNWIVMFSQQVQRISDLASRLKEFAHVASGDSATERVDLNRCVDAALALVADDLQRGGIVLQCSLSPDCAEIRGCATSLRQALLELLINARDAMPGGGTVRIATSREGSRVLLRLSDSGPGIAEDVRDGLFKPFVTTKGAGRGGLGLAICARVVGQMGGEIRLEENGGSGASFLMRFPVLEEGSAQVAERR